jgi:hypothetical protein
MHTHQSFLDFEASRLTPGAMMAMVDTIVMR